MDRLQRTSQKFDRYSHSSKKSFRSGGNRNDPLNLNELIEKKNQSTISSNNFNDQTIEILLPPDIYDPLGLDYYSSINLQQVPQ